MALQSLGHSDRRTVPTPHRVGVPSRLKDDNAKAQRRKGAKSATRSRFRNRELKAGCARSCGEPTNEDECKRSSPFVAPPPWALCEAPGHLSPGKAWGWVPPIVHSPPESDGTRSSDDLVRGEIPGGGMLAFSRRVPRPAAAGSARRHRSVHLRVSRRSLCVFAPLRLCVLCSAFSRASGIRRRRNHG
jgi:hypothetical protein